MLDILYIRQHYIRILFIFQRLNLLSFIICNTDKYEFSSIWKLMSCCNHVYCVIKRDVYPQKMHSCSKDIQGRIQRGGPGVRTPPPPRNFGKKVVIRFVIGTGLIVHSIYVNYSHKSEKGSKCGDLMVRTWKVDFSCIRLTPTEIRKSKYHIIRRVRFRWDPPWERYLDPRMISMVYMGDIKWIFALLWNFSKRLMDY